MDWSSVLDELIRAEKKSDEGKAVAVVLDKLTALTKNDCARVVVEFVVRDKRKAGALVKKLREHTNKEVQKKAIQLIKDWKEIVATESAKKEKEKEMRRPKDKPAASTSAVQTPPKDKGKGKRLAGEGVVQANEKRPKSNGAAAAPAAVDESPRVDDTPQPKGAVADQLSSHVVNLHQSLADFQGWMESGECAASTLGALRNSLGEVLEQMKQNSGKSVIFVGNNGVGKSWIINLLLLLTVATPSDYESQNEELKSEGDSMEQPPEDYVAADDDSDFRELRSALAGFCQGNNIPQTVKAFLLPSQDEGCSTTRTLIEIEYSKNFYCKVQYLKESDIRDNAWEWVQLNQDVSRGLKSRGHLTSDLGTSAQMYYEKAVVDKQKSFAHGDEAWKTLKSKNDLQLHERVLDLAGKTKEFHGRGKNIHLDRTWVREKLKGLATDEDDGYIQRNVRVGVPCKVVADCGMITDSPGCNTADPYLKQVLRMGLNYHEIVIAVGSRQIGDEKSTIDALRNSNFVTNLLNHPETYHLAYVHYTEKNFWGNYAEQADRLLDGDPNELEAMQKKAAQTMDMTRRSLKTHLFNPLCSTEEAAQATAGVTVLSVWPTLYTAIELDTEFRVRFTDKNGADDLERILKFTSTAELLSIPQFIQGQGTRTKFHSFRDALEQAIREQRQPGQGSSAMLSEDVLSVAIAARRFAVPGRGGRGTDDAKLVQEGFESKLEVVLESARDKAIELAESVIRKSVRRAQDEDEREDDLWKRFSTCAAKAAAAWEGANSPVNQLTDDTKQFLSAKWALSDSRLNIAQVLFKSLHDDGGMKFDFVIEAIKSVLADTVKQLVSVAIEFVKGELFARVKSDRGLAKRLEEYFAASVEPIVRSRCKLFFSYARRTMHITEENLHGWLLGKAEEKAVKKQLGKWYTKDRRAKGAAALKDELKAHIPKFVVAVSEELADSLGKIIDYQFKQLKQHLLVKNRPASKQTGMYSVVVLTFDFAGSIEADDKLVSEPAEKLEAAADELEGYLHECDHLGAKCGYEGPPRELAAVAQTMTEQMEMMRLERDLEMRYRFNFLKQDPVAPCVKRNGILPTPATPGELMSVKVDEGAIAQLQERLHSKGLELEGVATAAEPASASCLFEAFCVQRFGESEHTEERAEQLRYLCCSKAHSLRQQSKQHEFKTAFGLDSLPEEWSELLNQGYAERLSLRETPGDMLSVFLLAWGLGHAIDVWCAGHERPLIVCEATISERSKRHAYQLAVLHGKDGALSGKAAGYEFRGCTTNRALPLPPRKANLPRQPRALRRWTTEDRPAGPRQGRLCLIVYRDTLTQSIPRPLGIFGRRVSAQDLQEPWRKIEELHARQMKIFIPLPVFNRVSQQKNNRIGDWRKLAQNAVALVNFKLQAAVNAGRFWALQTIEQHAAWLRKWPAQGFSDDQRMLLWAKECNRGSINAVVVTADPELTAQCRNEGVPCIRPSGTRAEPGLLDLINLHLQASPGVQPKDVDYAELMRKHLAPAGGAQRR